MITLTIDRSFKGFTTEQVQAIKASARNHRSDPSKLPTCTMNGQTFPIVAVQTKWKRKEKRYVHRFQRTEGKMEEIKSPAQIVWRSRQIKPDQLPEGQPINPTSREETIQRTKQATAYLKEAANLLERAAKEVWGIEGMEMVFDETCLTRHKAKAALKVLQDLMELA